MTAGIALLLLSFAVALPSQQAPSPQKPPAASAGAGTKTLNVSSFERLRKAADEARNANRDAEAIRFYQQALVLRSAWPEGLWYLSTLFYQKERYPEARDVLRRFVTIDPGTGPGWALLGMSEFQTREYPRSLDHLRRAMALGMGDRKDMAKSVFYFVAVLLTRFERYDESMNLLMAMVKSGERTDLLVEPVGLATLRLPLLPAEVPGDRREMIHMAGKGALAVEAQQEAEAEKLFSGIVAAYPDEPGVHFLYGAFLFSDMRPEDGIHEMKRELEISPSHLPARLRLAEEYVSEQKLDEALSLAEEAVKLEPQHAPAHLMLGEVLVARGDLAGGIRQLETARDIEPQNVRPHWDLLRAYTAAGRTSDAKREKDEIEKLNRPGPGQ